MRSIAHVCCGAIAAIVFAAPGAAGPERINHPEGYAEEFVNYLDVDHIQRKRVRKMYVNPEAHGAAEAGEPLPDGTILIMEDHDADLDADGNALWNEEGRLIPQDPVTNLFVMQKDADWETANGNWEYAWFNPDGTRREDASFDGCFSCHANRAERDFTFTYWKFVADQAR